MPGRHPPRTKTAIPYDIHSISWAVDPVQGCSRDRDPRDIGNRFTGSLPKADAGSSIVCPCPTSSPATGRLSTPGLVEGD